MAGPHCDRLDGMASRIDIWYEPSGKYKDPTYHPFHHKIISVLAEIHISMENFRKW